MQHALENLVVSIHVSSKCLQVYLCGRGDTETMLKLAFDVQTGIPVVTYKFNIVLRTEQADSFVPLFFNVRTGAKRRNESLFIFSGFRMNAF